MPVRGTAIPRCAARPAAPSPAACSRRAGRALRCRLWSPSSRRGSISPRIRPAHRPRCRIRSADSWGGTLQGVSLPRRRISRRRAGRPRRLRPSLPDRPSRGLRAAPRPRLPAARCLRTMPHRGARRRTCRRASRPVRYILRTGSRAWPVWPDAGCGGRRIRQCNGRSDPDNAPAWRRGSRPPSGGNRMSWRR